MVDTSLDRDTLAISAHVSRPVMLKGKHVATEFVEVDCHIQMEEAEKIGCEFTMIGQSELGYTLCGIQTSNYP